MAINKEVTVPCDECDRPVWVIPEYCCTGQDCGCNGVPQNHPVICEDCRHED